jgi:hypothetical protein
MVHLTANFSVHLKKHLAANLRFRLRKRLGSLINGASLSSKEQPGERERRESLGPAIFITSIIPRLAGRSNIKVWQSDQRAATATSTAEHASNNTKLVFAFYFLRVSQFHQSMGSQANTCATHIL